MGLLKLPPEIIQDILVQCILVRGVQRGLRLKLVCKQIKGVFDSALYRTRLLDEFAAPQVGFRWCIHEDRYGSIKLWHGYLSYRVRGECDRGVGRYVEIREIAEAWQNFTADIRCNRRSLQEIIDGLCWLALERGTNRPGDRRRWKKTNSIDWQFFPESTEGKRNKYPASSTWNSLLCIAAYYNETSVASHIVQQHEDTCSPTKECDLFPSPAEIAASRGHTVILDLFQVHILARKPFRFSDDNSYIMWAHRTMGGAVKGALVNGDPTLLIRVLFPPTIRPCQPAVSHPFKIQDHDLAVALIDIQNYSSTPAVYDYIDRLLPDDYQTERARHSRLSASHSWYTHYGKMEMLRHLGRPNAELPTPLGGRLRNPLDLACRACFDDVADFLLDQNVKKSHRLLLVAVQAGSVQIMRKLLDHGVQLPPREHLTSYTIFADIICGENMAMLGLILEKGYVITEAKRQYALKQASKRGLESMVDLLNRMETQEYHSPLESDRGSGR